MLAVVFVFALSLLGVFEVILPIPVESLFFMKVLGGASSEHRSAYADSFFNGVLATALATPCTAPMLGPALGFAFAAPPATILAVFLTIGLGLALPYVLLSSHPGWLKFLPKPGAWMDTFKQVMGFVLLATTVWLLRVYGTQVGAKNLVWMLAFLLLLGFLAWFQGRFLDLAASTRKRVLIWGISLVVTVAGYQGFLAGNMEASGGAGNHEAEVSAGGIVWEPFTPAGLESAVAAGSTVFVDFTAEWCWTCKVNERTVLADSDVEERLKELGVVTLKGDWTSKDPTITEVLSRHGRRGVPFYAVYPAGRIDDVIVLPELITTQIVLESLDRAGPSRGAAAPAL
jgi:thiol:disulfide interchange protein DsbD